MSALPILCSVVLIEANFNVMPSPPTCPVVVLPSLALDFLSRTFTYFILVLTQIVWR